MVTYSCDICGAVIGDADGFFSMDSEQNLKNNPDGIFTLEYRPVKTLHGKLAGFGYQILNMCEKCTTRMSKTVFQEIRNIQAETKSETITVTPPLFKPEMVECAREPIADSAIGYVGGR